MTGDSNVDASLDKVLAKANNIAKIDEHHCNCHIVSAPESQMKLFYALGGIGAYDQLLQENHGQKWSLTYVIDNYWQLHVKMMPDNHIECELEARIRLVEHKTEASKPAHEEMRQLLEKFSINYAFVTPIPEPCKNRLLNTPSNPTDIVEILLAAAVCLLAFAILIAVARSGSRK